MTREEIENLVIEATGRTDKTTLIRQAIDIALTELSAQRLWSDLQTQAEATVTANVPYVALAADLARLTEVRLIDGTLSRPLLIRPKTWITERFPDPESRTTSRPVYGYVEDRTLWLIPIPDVGYTIRYTYFKLHEALAQSSDEVIIHHAGPAVAAYASHWVFQSLEKLEDAERWYGVYLRLLGSAKKIDTANSAIRHVATPRGEEPNPVEDYWLDPFAKRMP